MTGGSLQAEILARLSESPDERCICFYGARETLHWQSRSQLYSKSVAVAQQLRQEGVQPGDVCIIVLPSGEKAVNALLATLLLGAIPLLIAPPELVGGNLELHQTLRSAIHRTKPRVVVCSPSIQPERIRIERDFPATRFVFPPDVEETELKNGPFVPALPAPTDIAAMQLTSGTTGAPRICVWDHKGVLAALDGMAAAMALSADDVCANWTPLYHDMGLVNNFFLCLARGVPLVLLSPQEFVRRPALWLRCLSQTGATVTWSPNFGFALTVRKAQENELQGVRLDHVRAFWNAAERIHAETLAAFHRRFAALGVRREALKTNFGCAENVGGATFSGVNEVPPCEPIDRRLLDERGIARVSAATNDAEKVVVVSAGVAHPALKIRILSPRGRVLPDGRVGEICLDTPSRMLRFHQNARETRRALRGGLLHTGDLGYLRNGHLFWVGRVRDRITMHGKKIDPSTFESIFASTPGLREGCFAAFGIPDEQLGTERLIIVGEVRSPVTESLKNLAATISRKCFLQLGITPGDILLVPPGTLAKTSSGKRRHRYFLKLYLDGGLEQARMSLSDSMPAAAVAAQEIPESHLEQMSKLPLK
ncbi:MAG TPA: AMP-binding protein [Candidatus Angelobacter sp.]|jgi:acyl-CoA synthetase (AMP-forming)/AMP-acid ligase II